MSDYWRRRARLRAAGWTAFFAAVAAVTLAIWTVDGWVLGQQLLAQAGVLTLVALVAACAADAAR